MYEIRLTKDEVKLTGWLGEKRAKMSYEKYGDGTPWVKAKSQDKSLIRGHIMGVRGEFAFCKLFNLYPDLTWHPRIGGADCELNNGYTVDVKTTARRNGDLMVAKGREGKADILALMYQIDDSFYRFKGYIGCDDFFTKKHLSWLPKSKETYIAKQDELSFIGQTDLW